MAGQGFVPNEPKKHRETDEQRKEEAREERIGERLEREMSVEHDLTPKRDERRPPMASPRAPGVRSTTKGS